MATNEEMIGRDDLNDLEAILAITNTDVDEVIHAVKANADAIFTWDYERSRPAARQAVREGQDVAVERRDRPRLVDRRRPGDGRASRTHGQHRAASAQDVDLTGTPFEKWGDKEWIQLGIESQNWTLSQFMHGEQGALLCTAQIVETVPWIDAKYYAATQVMDEARHVEVFAKYLDEKLTGHYPINAHLKMLLDDIITDSRWDMTYLGMQIMVEGLALAAFGFMHQLTTEPLLKQLLRYVMSDEARHVAFGVLSLQGVLHGAHRRGDARAPGVRVRGRGAHARPLPPAGGVGAHGRRREGRARRSCMRGRTRRQMFQQHAVLEDRAELQEARPARRRRRLAARALHRARRDPVRGLGRHRRGVRARSTRSPRTAPTGCGFVATTTRTERTDTRPNQAHAGAGAKSNVAIFFGTGSA